MTWMSFLTSLGPWPGKLLGSFSLIVFSKRKGRGCLLHEEVEKGDEGGHPRLYVVTYSPRSCSCSMKASSVGAFYLRMSSCPTPVESRKNMIEVKEPRSSSACGSSSFVAQVALHVVLGRQIQGRDLSMIRSIRVRSRAPSCRRSGGDCRSCLGHLFLLLVRKSRLDDDLDRFGDQHILLRIGR
jgi:hypothetical protein